MIVALGADDYGFGLKQAVGRHLSERGHQVTDLGGHAPRGGRPYYEVALEVAGLVAAGRAERGILVCGTGMGMAIMANKHPGIYASVCETPAAAEKSRSINNSNVLTLGGMFTSPEAAREIVSVWLATEFTQGWEPEIQAWLRNSMTDIARLEQRQFGPPGR